MRLPHFDLGRADRWTSPVVPAVGPTPLLRVFVPIWRQSAGVDRTLRFTTLSDDTYGASLLAAAGAQNVYGDETGRYPVTTLAEALTRSPDLVLAPSEPYKFTRRHVPELEQVAPVRLVDGQDLFWWGSRTAGAIDRIGRLLRT